jgi:hypothetical protein
MVGMTRTGTMSRAPLTQSDSVSIGQGTCEIAEGGITQSYAANSIGQRGIINGLVVDVILDPCGPLSSSPD